MRKTLTINMVLLSLFAVTLPIRADVADYRRTNTSYLTFQINDDNAGTTTTLYNEFNKYFDLHGDSAYSSSMQLYNDRGIKETVNWFSQDGALVAPAFKYAQFAHTLSLTDNLGNKITNDLGEPALQLYYGSNMGKYDIDHTIVDLPDVGRYAWELDTGGSSTVRYTDPSLNVLDIIRVVTLDITDLARTKFGMDINSAYLLAWEDNFDYDYKDLGFIVFNATPVAATPEPASALIVGVGTVCAIPLIRRWRRKRNVEHVSEKS